MYKAWKRPAVYAAVPGKAARLVCAIFLCDPGPDEGLQIDDASPRQAVEG